MPGRILTSLSALGIVLAPALMRFAGDDGPQASSALADAEVKCVKSDGAPVHEQFKGTNDVKSRLLADQVVRVLERRQAWTNVAYTEGQNATSGWLTSRHLGKCPDEVRKVLAASDAHCLFGCPVGTPPQNELVQREIYTLSSNDDTKFADWVAYRVTKSTIGPSKSREWKADPDLDASETLEPDDYDGAYAVLHVDRGHQAPLASFSGTPYWQETNFLSNITPQKSELNQGSWMHLEAAERDLAKELGSDGVWVVTGPLFVRPMPKLPKADEPHRVPSGYFKVIAVPAGSTMDFAAYVLDQDTPREADFCAFETTVDEVERLSKLDLFPELPRTTARRLERRVGELALRLGCSQ